MPRITQKGQVTIPLPVRKILDIRTGDELIFEVIDNNVVVKKKGPSGKAFHKYVGFLSHLKGKESDDIINEIRGKSNDFSH